MAYNAFLADRVRQALAKTPNVEEKKMFRGVTFMVDGKMCISVGDNELMCRIDPALHQILIEKSGCRSVIMKGREYKGYVLVGDEAMKATADFAYWIRLALDFNKRAKASVKKKERK